MEKIVLKAKTYEAIAWPKQCPVCGAELDADHETKWVVKVKKGIKASFSSPLSILPIPDSELTPKSISVMICDKCSKKIDRTILLTNCGWGLAVLAFLFAIFAHRPQSQQEMMGAAGFFWLGVILGWLGARLQRRIVGIKIVCRSKDTWAFRFRSRSFANAFRVQNQ